MFKDLLTHQKNAQQGRKEEKRNQHPEQTPIIIEVKETLKRYPFKRRRTAKTICMKEQPHDKVPGGGRNAGQKHKTRCVLPAPLIQIHCHVTKGKQNSSLPREHCQAPYNRR